MIITYLCLFYHRQLFAKQKRGNQIGRVRPALSVHSICAVMVGEGGKGGGRVKSESYLAVHVSVWVVVWVSG